MLCHPFHQLQISKLPTDGGSLSLEHSLSRIIDEVGEFYLGLLFLNLDLTMFIKHGGLFVVLFYLA